MPPADRPLIVRLRNWVGDVTLSLPTLQRLADAGCDLHLVGKGWARDLLAGHGWPVHALPASRRDRVALLRRMRCEVGVDRRRGIGALCLPDSFSSALELRLAGLGALGHAWEGRRLLLARALRRPRGVHELAVYWGLGDALLGTRAPLPDAIALAPSARHVDAAAALRDAHRIAPGYVVVCPFAGGTFEGRDKCWPAFAEFVADELPRRGRAVVVCPGPGDEARVARERYPGAVQLDGVDLGTYAALLRDAAAMVSNDTGPGHVAAAVGTPLVSVLGPTDPAQWRPWGPGVQVLGGNGAWPDRRDVAAALDRALVDVRAARSGSG